MPIKQSAFDKIHGELCELCEYAYRVVNRIYRDGLTKRDGSFFQSHRLELANQRFKIVLIAPFQSGKSTIFNTFVGGREVSPTGSGVKTSACVVEAHYLDAGEEYAELEWRTDSELIRGLPPDVLPAIQLLSRSDARTLDDVAKMFRLSDPKHRNILQRSLAAVDLVQRGHAAPGDDVSVIPSGMRREEERTPDEERLRIGRLVLKYFTAVSKLRAQVRISIPEARALLAYPGDWSRRDAQWESYSPEQVLFLFLKRVRLHLRAPDLLKLRAVLIDCPGRGVSAVDNEVASECLDKVNAVIFLLGEGGKVMGHEQREELRWLRQEKGIEPHRIFAAYNARKAKSTIAATHVPVDLGELNVWFKPPLAAEDLMIFNALLALRSKQHAAFAGLSDETIASLAQRCRAELDMDHSASNDVLAREMIEWDIDKLYRDFLGKRVGDLDQSRAAELLAASGWLALVAKVTDFIASREGPELLGRSGIEPLRREMDLIVKELSDHIRAPGVTKEEWEKAKKSARENMANLLGRLNAIKEKVIAYFRPNGSLASSLKQEVHERIKAANVADALTARINSMRYPKAVAAELHEVIKGTLSGVAHGWLSSLQQSDTLAAMDLSNIIHSWDAEVRKELESAGDAGLLATLPFVPVNVGITDENIAGINLVFDPPNISHTPATTLYEAVTGVLKGIEAIDKADTEKLEEIREVNSVLRTVLQGSSMNHGHYRDQVAAIASRAEFQAVMGCQSLIDGMLASIQEQVRKIHNEQEAAIINEFDQRVKDGDKSVGSTVKERESVAVRAGEALRLLQEDVKSPMANINNIQVELLEELANEDIRM